MAALESCAAACRRLRSSQGSRRAGAARHRRRWSAGRSRRHCEELDALRPWPEFMARPSMSKRRRCPVAAAPWRRRVDGLVEACDGFLRRESLPPAHGGGARRNPARHRADARHRQSAQGVLHRRRGPLRGDRFPGQGFRSLGQEAIYAAAMRLRRGASIAARTASGRATSSRRSSATSASRSRCTPTPDGPDGSQRADGESRLADGRQRSPHRRLRARHASRRRAARDLVADGRRLALAFAREGEGRVAVSLIGEGGSSLGEWHEAINLCAARRLPAVFCVQNNQTALSTPAGRAVGRASLRRQGGGLRDPRHHARRHGPRRDRGRVCLGCGAGPRGQRPCAAWSSFRCACAATRTTTTCSTSAATRSRRGRTRRCFGPGLRAPASSTNSGRERDPIALYAARLSDEGMIGKGDLARFQARGGRARGTRGAARHRSPVARAGERRRRRARERTAADARRAARPVPPPKSFGSGPSRSSPRPPSIRREIRSWTRSRSESATLSPPTRASSFSARTWGGSTETPFCCCARCSSEFGDRILEFPPVGRRRSRRLHRRGAGGAAADRRDAIQRFRRDRLQPARQQRGEDPVPVGRRRERMSRWSSGCPGAASATPGPYHSQNTEGWFYRTPGLKIVVPSTPHDARALFASAVADPDPVLYFEHIALYRDPRVKQALVSEAPEPIPIGKAALRRKGKRPRDLALRRVRPRRDARGRKARGRRHRSVRSRPAERSRRSTATRSWRSRAAATRPDRPRGHAHRQHRGEHRGDHSGRSVRVRSTRPIRILGALDTPVPYSPPLEEFFLPSEDNRARLPSSRRV